uniref:Uncharacterized protein n=1 Tax=Chenopodium quinoa TaxID=63459 RepID=A0A803L0Z7_CHEQI
MTESVEHCCAAVTDEDKNVKIFKTPTQPVLPKIYYNSRGDKLYILGCSLENKLILGMKFDSRGDGISFYYKYAKECGFKVRSSTTKVDKNKVGSSNGKGVTVIKYFLCSKEGYVTNNKKAGKQVEGKSIHEIPDLYIMNRWKKDIMKKASATNVVLDDASKYDKKKQLMLTKNNLESATSSKEVKDVDIKVLVGSNEVDVNILPPNQCLNKGSARSSKRLKSVKEIASEEKSKKGRICRACGQSGVSHDSRNFPNK